MSVRDNLSAPKAAAITVLDTLEEVTANTSSGKPAGALAVKQLNTNVNKVKIYVGSDGKLHFTNASGADTALNFSKGLIKYESISCGEQGNTQTISLPKSPTEYYLFFGMGTGNSASQYYYWQLTNCTYDTLIGGNVLPEYAGVFLKVKVSNNASPQFTFRGHGSKMNYVCFS